MLKLRKEEGMGAVAKRLVPLVEKVNGEFVVYEGARSVEEVDQLRRKYGVVVIAINASPQARFRRLQRRGGGAKPRGVARFAGPVQSRLWVWVWLRLAFGGLVVLCVEIQDGV